MANLGPHSHLCSDDESNEPLLSVQDGGETDAPSSGFRGSARYTENRNDTGGRVDFIPHEASSISRVDSPEANDTKGVTLIGILIAMVPLVSSFQFGVNVAVTSPLFRKIDGKLNGTVLMNSHADGGLGMTQQESDFFASCISLGAMVGALSTSVIQGWLGPRMCLFFCGLLYACGAILQAMAIQVTELISGRIISGFGLGIGSVAAPMYIADVAAPSIRGVLGVANQLLIVFGCFTTMAIGIPLAGKWRYLSWAQVPAPVLLILCTMFIPRSPKWLVSKGKYIEARAALMRLRGYDRKLVEEEVNRIAENVRVSAALTHKPDRINSVSDTSMFGPSGKAMGIIVTMMVVQQFSGIAAVVFYGGSIFMEAGLGDPNIGAAICQAVQLVFTIVACVSYELRCTCSSTGICMFGCPMNFPMSSVGVLGTSTFVKVTSFAYHVDPWHRCWLTGTDVGRF
eukprot:m.1040275 g.1040275  ORF g.1040275 m.1040275 type:complete len:456 (+) comp24154_c0_seq22:353-1720(+)